MRQEMEHLLYEHGVDIVFSGHVSRQIKDAPGRIPNQKENKDSLLVVLCYKMNICLNVNHPSLLFRCTPTSA